MSSYEEIVVKTRVEALHTSAAKRTTETVITAFIALFTCLFLGAIFFPLAIIGIFAFFSILFGGKYSQKDEVVRKVDCPACSKETVLNMLVAGNILKIMKASNEKFVDFNDYDFECTNCRTKMHYLNEYVIYKKIKESAISE